MTKCEHNFLVHLFNTEIIDMDQKYKLGRYPFAESQNTHPVVEKWFRNKMRSLSKENSTLNKMYNLFTFMNNELIEAQHENVDAYNELQRENDNLKKSLAFLKYWLKKTDKK